MSAFNNPIFQDETKAREFLEAQRWPDGPVCPFCGQLDRAKALPATGALGAGWYHCPDCRKKFTVRVGTLYERSHIPLHKWLYATHLLVSSKKGISAHQLSRSLGITYKSAWFMAHRIREGMAPAKNAGPLGGAGMIVEADEMFIGKKPGKRKAPGAGGYGHKMAILSLVERDGSVRSTPIERASREHIRAVMDKAIDPATRVFTDKANHYRFMPVSKHETVDHSKGEYARGPVHTNTVEGVFSIFRRGMVGTYQHCGEQHLHRYLAEFDFRYSNRAKLGINDEMRAAIAIKGIEGKRLTYRRTVEA